MNRRFCDICGKEIFGEYKFVKIETYGNTELKQTPSKEIDVCAECYKEFSRLKSDIIKYNYRKERGFQ